MSIPTSTSPPVAAPDEWVDELARMFKALGDPVRLRLWTTIAARDGGRACVCDVSASLPVSQPTVSHHLRVLREAGLLTSERRGSWVYYAVVPGAVEALSALLAPVVGTSSDCPVPAP